MTRVEALFAQIMELTPSEQQEVRERLDLLDINEEAANRARMEEIDRRVDEIKAGTARGVDADEVFRQARAELEQQQQPA